MTSANPSSDVRGTVAFGFVGTPSSKRLDAYGVTVNATAALNSREPGTTMTPQVLWQLSAVSCKALKTPKRR
jgi:hypothetical protein